MGFGPMRHHAKFSTSRLILGGISSFGPDARPLEGDTRMRSPHHDAASNPTSSPDVLVNNVGKLYTFCPLTLQAKEWIDEHVQGDAQWFGHVLIVEHRYAWELAQGMKDDGLELA
jgi:hypothetical protein